MTQLESEISNEKKNAQKDKSFIDKLKRDRDVYERELERAEMTNKKLEEEFKSIEKIIKEK
jgi:CO dehydrogenase nickel-insertion accessory protein CooC1